MDHQEAVAKEAVEKYLSGEMSEAERLSFEEHYFGCAECAADVEAGAILSANVQAVFSEEKRRARGAAWWSVPWLEWRWAAAALAGLLLVVVGYQELVRIPAIRSETEALRRPQTFMATFLRPVARSGEQAIELHRGAPFLALYFDVPAGTPPAAYQCRLIQAGKTRWTAVAPPPAPGDPIYVLIPAQAIAPGEHTLALLTPGGEELARFEFTLRFK